MDRLLAEIRHAPTILAAMRRADRLTAAASSPGARRDIGALVRTASDDADGIVAIAAAHALGRIPDAAATAALGELLVGSRVALRPHAAWVLAARGPEPRLVEDLVGLVASGGLGGMLAQDALGRWSTRVPDRVLGALRDALDAADDATVRGRLIESVGLVPSDAATAVLRAAVAGGDVDAVRTPAASALADRTDRHRLARDGSTRVAARPPHLHGQGLRVVQVHLRTGLDPSLSSVGMGDTGGVATLLVRLGDALTAERPIGEVITVGRATGAAAWAGDGSSSASATSADGRHRFRQVHLPAAQGALFTDPWPSLVGATRELRRVLGALGHIDVLHLRMADVGTLAAQRVALELGVPTVFTLAPDPHALIAALDDAGALDRSSFLAADAEQALWYRAWLVRRLASLAHRVVLLPRPNARREIQALVGVDTDDRRRVVVVPEGIDLERTAAARAEIADRPRPPVVAELADRLDRLPRARRGLPLLVSVGRLAEVKGMARLVEAYVGDAELAGRANLVIVGGDLVAPSPQERAELDAIDDALRRRARAAEGVVLLGHRSNDDVARILAAAHVGVGDSAAPGGAYVSGSRKEEFGLAIVEALAAGLPVVAPIAGGPSTYVEDGRTGVLVDATDRAALAAAMGRALDLAPLPGRAELARATVRTRFSIATMARDLAALYADAAPASRATAA